jgi:2-amino-4-hydroxy-6-hydroxymethyldihydropteridine diphosphokinase
LINGARIAYIGLGSNLDDPVAQILRALDSLHALPMTRVVSRSRLYRNPPLGPPDQPDYVNAVAAVSTGLDAADLLSAVQSIEREQGRTRDGVRWGPRTLDLDILVYADAQIDQDGLRVPHAGIAERPFVLVPLAEIAPELHVPGLGPIAALLSAIDCSGLVAVDDAGA